MFKVGQTVIYGGVGLCRVEAVGQPGRAIPGADGSRQYYTLRPLQEEGVVYTPVDAEVFMRPVMSREEALRLIDGLPAVTELEDVSGDYRRLSERYRAALHTHRTQELLRLLKTLWMREVRLRAQGKLPGKVDRQFQQTAERFLYTELGCALDIPAAQVAAFIRERLEGDAGTGAASTGAAAGE